MKQQTADVINIKITAEVESACGGVVGGNILYLPTSSKLPRPALNSVLQRPALLGGPVLQISA